MFKIIPRSYAQFPKKSINTLFRYFIKKELIENNDIANFEKKFADYIKVKYAIAVPSARIGLNLILKVLKIGKDDEIILSSYNSPIIPNIISINEARPTFVDANPETYNIDPKLIEQKITKKTKVIIVTHIEGLPCDLNSILKITRKYRLNLIEDCAHALGAEYKREKVGSFGKAAIFSFGVGKHLNTFGGGAIATNDVKLADTIRNELKILKEPTNFHIIKKYVSSVIVANFTKPFFFNFIVYPLILITSIFNLDLITKVFEDRGTKIPQKTKYSNFQAAIGIQQLKIIENRIKKRIKNAQILNRHLNKKIKRQSLSKNTRHSYLNYSIELQDREIIRKKLLLHGIDIQPTWMRSCSLYSPVSERLEKNVLYLPIYETLDEKDVIFISNILNKILDKNE